MNGATRIFLGDLARALAGAGSRDGQNWDEIAGLLGLTRRAPATPSASETVAPLVTGAPPAGPTPARHEVASASEAVPAHIGELVEFDLDRQTAPRSPLSQSVPAPAEQRGRVPLPLPPLLDPSWQRGILIEAVGRQSADGDIAVLEAVQAIARGEPLTEVPREKIQSVSSGSQVLIDTGVGMRPFASDARDLVAALRRTVGAEHTRVFTFVDCPTRGVLSEAYDDEPYQAPDSGAVVLAVSDLVAGGPASAIRRATPGDWLKVARAVHDAGSVLIVLNPYPRLRWPPVLSARLPIIYWDRTTRATDVRSARRRMR